MELTDAERELIELLRREDETGSWALTVSHQPGHWVVAIKSPGFNGAQGDGSTFSEAWERQIPNFAHND